MLLVFTTFLVVFAIAKLIHSLFKKNDNSNKTIENHSQQQPIPPSNEQYDADVIIVGGGVVGSALAHTFGKMKKRVINIERDLTEPDRIVGELLQPGGFGKLKELGLEHTTQGIDAATVVGYGVFFNGEQVRLTYPNLNGDVENPTGRAFHYGRFVMNLRKAAREQETVQVVEGVVTALIEDETSTVKGVTYKLMSDQSVHTIRAPLTIVANGAGSTFTKKLNTAEPKVISHFIGLELQGSAPQDLPFPGCGNVFVTPHGPVLCYPTSSNSVRCLIDFTVNDLPNVNNGDMAKRLRQVYAPVMPEKIRQHFLDAIDQGRIRSAPNREMAAEAVTKKGCILIGDAFNCRHPLTGGGMTVGLSDVVQIRDCFQHVNLYDGKQVEDALAQFYVKRKKVASTINILANALYAIFAASGKDDTSDAMKQAVFEYFKRGGNCVTGPVGLLGGLIESPYILLMHFFSVALYFAANQLLPCPTPKSLYNSFRLVKTATMIVSPLIADEKLLQLLFPILLWF